MTPSWASARYGHCRAVAEAAALRCSLPTAPGFATKTVRAALARAARTHDAVLAHFFDASDRHVRQSDDSTFGVDSSVEVCAEIEIAIARDVPQDRLAIIAIEDHADEHHRAATGNHRSIETEACGIIASQVTVAADSRVEPRLLIGEPIGVFHFELPGWRFVGGQQQRDGDCRRVGHHNNAADDQPWFARPARGWHLQHTPGSGSETAPALIYVPCRHHIDDNQPDQPTPYHP